METTAKKVVLRQQMRERLAALPPATVREQSAAITARLAGLPVWAAAEWLLVYLSRDHEVTTHGLIQQLLASGRRVGVPKFDEATQQYVVAELRDFSADLVVGKFRILEPRPEAVRPVPLARLEALLVPGLAFDRAGNRLGRGKGYFDRLLAAARGIKIGVAYNFQIVDDVPVHRHDARLDFVVTETSTITCGRPRQEAGRAGRVDNGERTS